MTLRGVWTIVVLDMKRFWLDRARLIAGLIQPLLYLFVLGSGLGANSQYGPDEYRRFIFPGTICLALLMSATFAAISIVFDRQIGFFKAVLVAPVPRTAIALGKVVAGALQALIQGFILLMFAPIAGVHLTPAATVAALGALVLAAMAFSAMGVAVACRFTSTTVFPIVSNAVLIPMFFLSGSLYPLGKAPKWMQVAAHVDPVAYGVDLVRGSLSGQFFFHVPFAIAMLGGFIAILTAISVRIFNRGEDDSALGQSSFRFRR